MPKVNSKSKINYTGALPDTRKRVEKLKDFQHEELFGMSSPVEWKERTFKQYLPLRNQDGSGACGGFAGALALGINEYHDNGTFAVLSPAFLYTNRKNKNSEGMNMIDLCEIMTKLGAPMDNSLTSDNLNEAQINSLSFTQAQKKDALKFKGKDEGYLFVKKDIDSVADVINKGYTPIFLIRCMADEYTTDPQVLYPEKKVGVHKFTINHYIPATDYGMRNGVKVISVQESWNQTGLRYFTDDFIRNRVEAIVYVIDLPTDGGDKPSYIFTIPLVFGQNLPEVKRLQEMLRYEQFFPSGTPTTGYFGSITARALQKWQVKHGIMDFATETNITKIRFGKKSIEVANKLYGSN